MKADVTLAQDQLINLVGVADVAGFFQGATAAGGQERIKELQQENAVLRFMLSIR